MSKKKKDVQMDIDDVLNSEVGVGDNVFVYEGLHQDTGVVAEGKLNEVNWVRTLRPNGTVRIQQDFSFCPSMADQVSGKLTDINYLIERYKPDELAAYIAARAHARPEILGHDFSVEPNMQEAQNVVYKCRKLYDELAPEVKMQFRTPLEFVQFIDNPANAEKMVKLGLIERKQADEIKAAVPVAKPAPDVPLDPVKPGDGKGA